MNTFVVDTNVAIVANGGHGVDADESCQLTCAERLERLVQRETVAVDETGLLIEEYARHLSWAGAPGVGDMFFKHLVDRQYAKDRVCRVSIIESDDDRRGFEQLPANDFDPSDRKFLAVAVVADAVVMNATDSDWEEHADLMNELGVEVDQLCPQHASK